MTPARVPAVETDGEVMHSYCLFCKGGEESRVMEMLRRRGAVPLSPWVVKTRQGKKELQRAQARLLPGYVFFDYAGTPRWEDILRFSSVLKVLQYEDGERALRHEDLSFVTWLKKYEGLIDVSQVVKVGTKITFVGGPLMGMEGKVLKVNKSRRQVQISVGGEGNLFHAIWCAIEYVQDNLDLELLHRQAQMDEGKS